MQKIDCICPNTGCPVHGNWVHSYMGSNTGYVYCAEDEREETRDYYADFDNYDSYVVLSFFLNVEIFVKISILKIYRLLVRTKEL